MKHLNVIIILALLCNMQVSAQKTDRSLQVGDSVLLDGKYWIVGTNLVTNASFDENPESAGGVITGWTGGNYYNQWTTDNVTWYPEGGFDGGPYIQSKGSGGAASDNAMAMRWNVEQDSKYFFCFWLQGTKGETNGNLRYIIASLTSNNSEKGGQNEYEKSATEVGKTLIGKNGDDKSESSFGLVEYNSEDTWCRTAIFFNSEEYTYLQFNARWLKATTCFDGFYLSKLYDPDVTEPEDIAKLEYASSINKAETWCQDNLVNFEALYYEFYDYLGDHQECEGETIEEINAEIKAINETMASYSSAATTLSSLMTVMTQAENLINTTSYKGIDAFVEVYEEMSDYVANGYYSPSPDVSAVNYAFIAYSKLNQAIDDYRYSQGGSFDNPADYTFLMQSPCFTTAEATPTFDEEGNISYPNAANYSDGKTPSDAISTGWYIGTSGGDQRLNYKEGRVCWNAWNTKFTNMSINQDITGLPNGYYTISAEMMTQQGCFTDQHLYAKSTIQTTSSDTLANCVWQWDSPYDGTWETLTTRKVIVTDGKLTVGAYSTGDSEHTPAEFDGGQNADYRRGWFLVTNFKLLYYGEARFEDLKEIYSQSIADAQALCDSMHLSADKAAFQAAIDANSNAGTADEINTCMAAVNEALTIALKSETEYQNILSGTLSSLKDSIATSYGEYETRVAQQAVNVMMNYLGSDAATYTETGAMTAILRYYLNSYIPALQAAVNCDVKDETARQALQDTYTQQVDALETITSLPETVVLEQYMAQMSKAVQMGKAADLYNLGGDDYTPLISNSNVDDSAAKGWTLVKTAGSGGVNKGAHYDGGSGYYLDVSGTKGKILYTAYQTIENIPNGTYLLKALNRLSATPGEEGAYLFAIADNDTSNSAFAPMHSQLFDYGKYYDAGYIPSLPTDENGEPVLQAYVTNTYGPVWAEACDWMIENEDKEIDESDIRYQIFAANNERGYGWFCNSLQIEVRNHTLTLGVTCDSTLTLGHDDTEGNPCVPSTCAWFSADNFTLTLLQTGDNKGWTPATAISDPDITANGQKRSTTDDAIYNLSGMKVGEGYKGIVIRNGKKQLLR